MAQPVALAVGCWPAGRGAPKKKKMKATYIWQMINQVGRYLPSFFFNFEIFFTAFLCVSQQGEFKNT
jgi:hypothetical protein